MAYIKINKIDFGYDYNKKPLFNELFLEFDQGEIISIIGRNGAGKTTLAKLIIGMIRPQKGEIIIEDENTSEKSTAKIAEKVGYVFQNPNIMLFSNSVRKELELSLMRFNITKEEIQERITEVVDFFSLNNYLEIHPRLLSRGEKQKLAIATVLVQNPQAIILDEPFSGIDNTQKNLIRTYLNELKNQKKLIIVITHDLDSVLEFSDKVIVLDNGQVTFNGSTQDFFMEPENLHNNGLVETKMLSMVYSLRSNNFPKNILKRNAIISFFKEKFT